MAGPADVLERLGVAWSLAGRALYTVPSRALSGLSPLFVTRLLSSNGKGGIPTVYLTFDDGPTSGHTASILDVLSNFEAHATFFLTTERVADNEAVVRKIAEAGHVVGVHGHTHSDPWLRSASAVRADLERSRLIVRGLLGTEIDWVRPAYGHVRPTTFQFARAHDLRIAGWDVMPGDFVKGIDARLVFRRVASGTRPGSIVVLHDNDRVRESAVTLDALEMTLRYFADRGWRFEALPTTGG